MYHQKNADFLFFSRVMHVTVKTSSVGRSDTISYVTHIIDLGQLLSRILRKISIPQMLQIDQLGCPKCHRSNSWDDPNVTDRPVEMSQMSQIDQLSTKCHRSISWDDPNVTYWTKFTLQISKLEILQIDVIWDWRHFDHNVTAHRRTTMSRFDHLADTDFQYSNFLMREIWLKS